MIVKKGDIDLIDKFKWKIIELAKVEEMLT